MPKAPPVETENEGRSSGPRQSSVGGMCWNVGKLLAPGAQGCPPGTAIFPLPRMHHGARPSQGYCLPAAPALTQEAALLTHCERWVRPFPKPVSRTSRSDPLGG